MGREKEGKDTSPLTSFVLSFLSLSCPGSQLISTARTRGPERVTKRFMSATKMVFRPKKFLKFMNSGSESTLDVEP